jgi:ribosomal-protein-alanine N-acetyltransferase
MPLPPTIHVRTDRLLIRPVTAADLDDLLLVNGDDTVTYFLPYATWQSLADGVAWLARVEGMTAGGSGQQLVMERTADGKVIGAILLFRYDEASSRLEVGYVLGRHAWHQGYATEALRGVIGSAFTEWGIRRIEAEVNPDNQASTALLLRLGFVQEGRLRQRWVAKGRAYDTNIYGYLHAEWGSQTPLPIRDSRGDALRTEE